MTKKQVFHSSSGTILSLMSFHCFCRSNKVRINYNSLEMIPANKTYSFIDIIVKVISKHVESPFKEESSANDCHSIGRRTTKQVVVNCAGKTHFSISKDLHLQRNLEKQKQQICSTISKWTRRREGE